MILVIGVIMLGVGWVGYVGTDDHSYARGALGWLNHFPYVGTDHWTLRHTVVIPVAVSLAIFGIREVSLGLPSALLFLLMLGVNYRYLERFLDARFALLASTFLATTPLVVVQATFPQDTIAQLFAVSLSFWFFYSSAHHERASWRLFAVGVAAAFGWLTLETTAGLILFYGILFLIGYGVPRRCYGIMALGFVLVVGIEMGYLTALTGDPLYRYRIDLFHDVIDRVGEARVRAQMGTALDFEGNLSVNVFLEPIVTLLINQEFGLLFWAFIPAAIWIWRTPTISPEERRLMRLLSGLGLVWLAFISLNISVLWVVPRYYAVATWAAVIVVAYWFRHFVVRRWPKVAVIVGAGFLTTNLLCVYLENKNPLFAERALVEYAVSHRGPVYTDPMTMNQAKLLLEFKGVSERVLSDPAPSGALVYVNRTNIESCKRISYRCRWQWEQYLPKPEWVEINRIDPPRKLTGILLTFAGLDKTIPEEIFTRFDRQLSGGIFYLAKS